MLGEKSAGENIFKLTKKQNIYPTKYSTVLQKGLQQNRFTQHVPHMADQHCVKLIMLPRTQGLVSITAINYDPLKGFPLLLHINIKLAYLSQQLSLIRFYYISKDLFKIHCWVLLCFEPFVLLLCYLSCSGDCVCVCVCVFFIQFLVVIVELQNTCPEFASPKYNTDLSF